MRFESPSCIVRDWSPCDKDAVARFCGDRTLWRNLTDTFPHACTAADMDAWLAYLSAIAEPTQWAVEASGRAVGGIGIMMATASSRARLTSATGWPSPTGAATS